jgi:hypothetical protein
MINEPQRYVYQKDEIKTFPWANVKGGIATGEQCCGASSASIISGDDPQMVAEKIGPDVPDTTIIKYLTDQGWTAELITSGGNEASGYAWTPTQNDFDKIDAAISGGKLILWHFPGHYTVCVGKNDETGDYIFYDPAGDRKKGYFNTGGKNAEYPKYFLIAQRMKPIWGLA